MDHALKTPGARLAIAAVVALIGSAACAAPTPFPSCDGYAAPNKYGDNMTRQGGWLGHQAGADSTIREQEVGAAGVEACTAALEDPSLLATQWMRRANLLRARAIHRLADGDADGAIADLDQADALIPADADVYFRRSLGVDLTIVRAYALALNGERARAYDLALHAWRLRPYAPGVAMGVAAAMQYSPMSPEQRAVWQRAAQLTPRLISPQFIRFVVTPPPPLLNAPPVIAPMGKPLVAPSTLLATARRLLDAMPDPETAERAPAFKEAKRPMLAMHNSIYDWGTEGFRIYDHPDDGMTTVEFRASTASPAMVEEAALLKAADMAIAAGKRGFIIVGSKNIHLNLNNVSYGVVVSSGLLNRQTLLDVVFVDPDHLPAKYEDSAWRVLDAAEVHAALAPVYPPPPPAPH